MLVIREVRRAEIDLGLLPAADECHEHRGMDIEHRHGADESGPEAEKDLAIVDDLALVEVIGKALVWQQAGVPENTGL